MFFEPLEARQLLVADSIDAEDATDGGTGQWAEELLAYEESVGPASDPSTSAAYHALADTPLDWQAAVGDVVVASSYDQSASDAEIGSTSDLPFGDDVSPINMLTQETSLGMLADDASGIPASSVSTITTLEQWDADTQQTVQWLAAFDDASLLQAGADAVDDAAVDAESNADGSNSGTTNFVSWASDDDSSATNVPILAASWSDFDSDSSDDREVEDGSPMPATLATLLETGSVLSTLQSAEEGTAASDEGDVPESSAPSATPATEPAEVTDDEGEGGGAGDSDEDEEDHIALPNVTDVVPKSTLGDYNANNGDGEFQPIRTDNFTDTTNTTICSGNGGVTVGGGDGSCTDSEASSTHTITQVYTDADHWMITETIVANYNMTRESTDADGGTTTASRSGHFDVTLVIAKGMDTSPDAGIGLAYGIQIDVSDTITVSYVYSNSETLPGGSADVNLTAFVTMSSAMRGAIASRPILSGPVDGEMIPGRETRSAMTVTLSSGFGITAGWSVTTGEGDLAAGDGFQLTAGGDMHDDGNSTLTLVWDYTTRTHISTFEPAIVGTGSVSLVGGGGGHVNDSLSLVVKAKEGDLSADNGWTLGAELGWNNGSDYDSNYRYDYATMTTPMAEGGNGTVVTRDEFNLTANSGGDTKDWFRVNYDAKTKSVSDTTGGGWTSHSESKSTVQEELKQESNSTEEFSLTLSKSTGSDPSGSASLTSEGGSSDETHVRNESEGKSEDNYDDGYGTTEKFKSESKSKYTLDDVFGSESNGGINVTLNADGTITLSGSVSYEEEYKFDQMSSSEDKWSEETSTSWTDTYSEDPESGPAPPAATSTDWDKWEYEWRDKTTDHYEATFSSSLTLGSNATPTYDGSDEGWTEYETSDKSCHSWDYSGTSGGPVCSGSGPTTVRENWPSYVDEVIAMMESEADEMSGGAEGDESGPCATCSEIDQGDGEEGGDGENNPPIEDEGNGRSNESLGTRIWEMWTSFRAWQQENDRRMHENHPYFAWYIDAIEAGANTPGGGGGIGMVKGPYIPKVPLTAGNALQAAVSRGMRILRGPTAPDDMVSVLEKLGKNMTREEIGTAIHAAKRKMNIGAAEDVIFDHSGGLWDSRTGEYIGKIWEAF